MAGELLALPFGVAIGVLLGLVGGGGSILAVPVLVYVLGQPVHAATTESLLVVGSAALVGAADHTRVGNVRIKTALAFGLAGSAGAIGGSALNRLVGGPIILLGFAALLLLAAYAMQRRRGFTAEPIRRPQAQLPAAATGLLTGLLTGLFGVGGGFVIVPALVLLLGLPITLAVGTSLAIIALTSASALAAHLASGRIDWGIATAFAAAAIAGALVGRRLGGPARPAPTRHAVRTPARQRRGPTRGRKRAHARLSRRSVVSAFERLRVVQRSPGAGDTVSSSRN
jgi:uncharacterized membrane protein YfcA